MSKHNGSRTGREKEKHFERRRVSDPTEIQRNGISILAVGPIPVKSPTRFKWFCMSPGHLTHRESRSRNLLGSAR